jgi:hypothetical protein
MDVIIASIIGAPVLEEMPKDVEAPFGQAYYRSNV